MQVHQASILVPSGEGEEPLVEGGADGSNTPVGVLEGILVVLDVSITKLINARDDDDQKRHDFRCGENSLYFRGPFDVRAVHPG